MEYMKTIVVFQGRRRNPRLPRPSQRVFHYSKAPISGLRLRRFHINQQSRATEHAHVKITYSVANANVYSCVSAIKQYVANLTFYYHEGICKERHDRLNTVY